jgi:hypothetical protein
VKDLGLVHLQQHSSHLAGVFTLELFNQRVQTVAQNLISHQEKKVSRASLLRLDDGNVKP